MKGIEDVFTAPIVYPPAGGWENDVPQRIKDRVIWERLDLALRGEWDRATDSEVVCYLFPASLMAPLDSDWTDIYLWITAQVIPELKEVVDVPTELTEWHKSQLDELRFKIRKSQIKNRKKRKEVVTMETKQKVILDLREGEVLVWNWRPGCDPTQQLVIGGLTEALAAVPGIIEAAEEHWKDHPMNPKAAVPKVESKPAPKAPDLPLLSQDATPEPKAEEPTAEPKAEEHLDGGAHHSKCGHPRG